MKGPLSQNNEPSSGWARSWPVRMGSSGGDGFCVVVVIVVIDTQDTHVSCDPDLLSDYFIS